MKVVVVVFKQNDFLKKLQNTMAFWNKTRKKLRFCEIIIIQARALDGDL